MIINPSSATNSIQLTPTPLRRTPNSPYCYCASLSPPDFDNIPSIQSTTLPSPSSYNFLATQVWPSARLASFTIEKYCNPNWKVCECGCGPGLPSIVAASLGCEVIATDLDVTAMQMVELAAAEQGFVHKMRSGEENKKNKGRLDTRRFDLTSRREELPAADLYVMSDVFESGAVAKGAAWHVWRLLDDDADCDDAFYGSDDESDSDGSIKRVWVFAQSDRAQRDIFLKSLKDYNSDLFADLDWDKNHEPDLDARIWLFDLDEMDVQYN